MINLLPNEEKKQIIAGRSNVSLVNYIIILCIGMVFLVGITIAVYVVIMGVKTSAESLTAENTSKSASFGSIRNQAESLRASLANAKLILDKEVIYTDIITAISGALPSGIILESLSLSPTTIGTPITLVAYARSTNDALRLKNSFQQSPLFSNVSFQSLAFNGQSTYPITVNLNVTINKGIVK